MDNIFSIMSCDLTYCLISMAIFIGLLLYIIIIGGGMKTAKSKLIITVLICLSIALLIIPVANACHPGIPCFCGPELMSEFI